ncbi:hypothetical protein BCV70DRAFT_202311 [Testicularia cyperi]|uniref:Uncharacterized protein n=1 Tax=Testicularia cyperi TaxID=1882483 RepID=A0A317XLF4_9BASI|nr:hypothetical protein BCV70DRAFT_202311 [Testicularia cyperi]
MATHFAQEPTIKGILTSLFVVQPPTLLPEQLSDNLRMRHRLLGLSNTPPKAFDLQTHGEPQLDLAHGTNDADTLLSDDDKERSRHDFVSWLVTNLGDSSQAQQIIDDATRSFFRMRQSVRRLAVGNDIERYLVWEMLCSDPWHQDGKRMVLLRLPADQDHALMLTLRRAPDGSVRFENIGHENPMFWLESGAETLMQRDLHSWKTSCDLHQDRSEEEQDEHDQGAEYISNANDFWSGFSDDEEMHMSPSTTKRAKLNGPGDEEDDYWNSYGQVAVDGDQNGIQGSVSIHDAALASTALPSSASNTSPDAAVKDIIRGALILYRSSNASNTTKQFLTLVRQVAEQDGSNLNCER